MYAILPWLDSISHLTLIEKILSSYTDLISVYLEQQISKTCNSFRNRTPNAASFPHEVLHIHNASFIQNDILDQYSEIYFEPMPE